MTEKKKTPAPGIVGLGDLLKQALAQRGGIARKPHKAPSRWANHNRSRRRD